MRYITTILITLSILPAMVSAKPPQKPRYGQFSILVTRSPFTIKPTQTAGVTLTPLERDWMLGSIRPAENGYAVTLINKKNRKDRIRFIPGFSSGEFKLLEVKQDPRSYKNSRVKIRKGTQIAWIGYDEKLIKVKPSGAAKAPVRKISVTKRPRTAPPIPGRNSTSGKSKHRVRHVPRTRRVPRSGR